MLSKLLSNINRANKASGDDSLSGGDKESSMGSSEQVFKSLLQSLQNEGESDKAKQQLLTLSRNSGDQQESAKGENAQKSILGGSFTNVEGKVIQNLEQIDQNILGELQDQFKDIKQELIADGQETSETEDAENSGDEKAKEVPQEGSNVSAENTEVEKEGGKQVDTDKLEGKEAVKENGEGKILAGQDSSEKELSNTAEENKQNTDTKVSTEKSAGGQLVKDVAPNKEGVIQNGGESESKEQSATTSAEKTEVGKSSSEVKVSESTVSKHPESTPVDNEKTLEKEQVDKVESKKEGATEKGLEGRKAGPAANISQVGNTEKIVDAKMQGKSVLHGEKRQPAGVEQMKASGQGGDIASARAVMTDQQKKVMNSFFQKNSSVNISNKGLEMNGVKNEKQKQGSKGKTENETRQGSFGKQTSESRNKLLNRLGLSNTNAQKEMKPLNLQNFSGITFSESSSSLEEQKSNWEDQISKTLEMSGEKESKGSSGAGSMRLGQMPVANVSLRKKILPGLTQNIQKAASSAQQNSGDWQKHNFTLDDGKNIQLSVRESKGVLQVKMGSMNLDLSKLLQQNLQQIREHLKQEFGSDIDLQFENQQQGEESQLSQDSEKSKRKRNYRNDFAGQGLVSEQADEVRTKKVRNFGYNQMEWTA